MRRLSLRARFLLLLIGLLLAVFTAITLVIVRQNTTTLKANLIDQSKSFAALATQPIGDAFVLYQDSGTIRIQQQVQRFTDLDSNINQVEIVDTSGKQLFVNDPANPIKVTSDAATSLSPSYLHDKDGNLVGVVQPYLESFGIHRYAVVYGISYQSVNHNIDKIVSYVIALSTIILLVSLVVWYFLINRLFLLPVARLSQIALLISKGDLNRQIKLGRNDEIGDLSSAVDTMASSLKANITKLQEVDRLKNEFMMITSHNLRTPITVITAYLDQIKATHPSTQLQEMLDPIGVNTMRLGGFAEDVLTISTIEAGQNILQQQPTDMGPILEAIAKDFSMMASQKKLQFTSHIGTTAKVNLSRPHFRSALWNLLDNAYKFTAEAGKIDLTARTVADQLEIVVKDSGIGIAQEEIPHLFTKFHRATSTLTYDYEGTGIGLYIAKLIVEQHGGHISVKSTEGEGSTFTILLPLIGSETDEPSQSDEKPSNPMADNIA
jgi:signal transduction histidine kinase